MTVEQAKKVLRDNGFFVDYLWHVDDVKQTYKCTDAQAQTVLDGALNNEAIIQEIFFFVDMYAEEEHLERKKHLEE